MLLITANLTLSLIGISGESSKRPKKTRPIPLLMSHYGYMKAIKGTIHQALIMTILTHISQS